MKIEIHSGGDKSYDGLTGLSKTSIVQVNRLIETSGFSVLQKYSYLLFEPFSALDS